MRVYLAGPIFECTDAEANGWRELVTPLLDGHEVCNPMRRDYRGVEGANAERIVLEDKKDLDTCDAVLAHCLTPSWGTAMEIHYAYMRGIPVIAVTPPNPSPWLIAHTTTVRDLGSAVREVTGVVPVGMRP
jgi:nucleoside 2-deoxyribosyltransferase